MRARRRARIARGAGINLALDPQALAVRKASPSARVTEECEPTKMSRAPVYGGSSVLAAEDTSTGRPMLKSCAKRRSRSVVSDFHCRPEQPAPPASFWHYYRAALLHSQCCSTAEPHRSNRAPRTRPKALTPPPPLARQPPASRRALRHPHNSPGRRNCSWKILTQSSTTSGV